MNKEFLKFEPRHLQSTPNGTPVCVQSVTTETKTHDELMSLVGVSNARPAAHVPDDLELMLEEVMESELLSRDVGTGLEAAEPYAAVHMNIPQHLVCTAPVDS